MQIDGIRLLRSGILHDTVVSPVATPEDQPVVIFRFDWTQPWELDPCGDPVSLDAPLDEERLHVWNFTVTFEGLVSPLGPMTSSRPDERRFMFDASPFDDAGHHCHFLDDEGRRTGWDLRRQDGETVAYCRRVYDQPVTTFLAAAVESASSSEGDTLHSVRFETHPAADIHFAFRGCSAKPSDDVAYEAWLGHPFWGPRFSELLASS